MDKCPNITILGQTSSDLLGKILEYMHVTVHVHQLIMKA